MEEKPIIGILGWEQGNEDTLAQLESVRGNVAHPDTFDFPLIYRRVMGACYSTVVVNPSAEVCAALVAAARELETAGVRAVMTGCGFNIIFQRELADAVAIPVFTSSLLQVPMVHSMMKTGQKVGIVTADAPNLTVRHLLKAGITPEMGVHIVGVEKTGEFSKVREDPKAVLDEEKFVREVVDTADRLVRDDPAVGAIVLECTDLPPASASIRRRLGIPVFDVVTLAHMVCESLVGERWGS